MTSAPLLHHHAVQPARARQDAVARWATAVALCLLYPSAATGQESGVPEPPTDRGTGAESQAITPDPGAATAGDQASAPDAGPPLVEPTDSPDTQPAGPAQGLTLEQAQRIAIERNPSLRAAQSGIERAEALVQQGWSFLQPSIYGSFQYTLNDQPTVVSFDMGLSSTFSDAQSIVVRNQHIAALNLNVRQPLFNGRAIPLLRNAYEGRDLTRLSVGQAQQQLALAVARAFYMCLSARATVLLLERSLGLAEEQLGAARARLEAQAGLAIDVARAELQVETTRSQLRSAQLARENARDALAMLLGEGPDDLPDLVEPAHSDEVPPDPQELERRALESRLDLRSAEAQVSMAERNIHEVWMQFLPSVDLTWTLNHTLTDLGGFGDRRTSWYLMLIATVPLYDAGIRYGQLRQRRAELEQATLAQEAAADAVATEVRSSYRAWETAVQNLQTSDRQLELASQAYDLATAAYAAGAASSLEVLDAQRTLVSSEVNHELQRLNEQLSLIELLASVEIPVQGGGAAARAPASATSSSGGSEASSLAAAASGGGGGAPY